MPDLPGFRGRTLQHWSLQAQQAHKQANLLALLRPLAPGLALDPPINSAASAYRHRLRLLVQRNPDQSCLLGMRRRGSHEAVAVRHCLVANTFVNQLLETLPAMLAAAPGLQGLREIEVDSDSRGQLGLCCYFAANPGDRGLALLRDALLTSPVVGAAGAAGRTQETAARTGMGRCGRGCGRVAGIVCGGRTAPQPGLSRGER